jgi:hypothetical protein
MFRSILVEEYLPPCSQADASGRGGAYGLWTDARDLPSKDGRPNLMQVRHVIDDDTSREILLRFFK